MKKIFLIILFSCVAFGQYKTRDSVNALGGEIDDVKDSYNQNFEEVYNAISANYSYFLNRESEYLLNAGVYGDSGDVIGYDQSGMSIGQPTSRPFDYFLQHSQLYQALLTEIQLIKDSLNALSAFVWGSGGVPSYTPVYTLNYSPTQQFYNTTLTEDSTKTIYIKNTGTGQLKITAIVYEAINTGRVLAFTHQLLNRTSGLSQDTIWASDSLKLNITYIPYDVGNEDAWRMLISSNGGAQDTINVYGSGLATTLPNVLYVSTTGNDSYPGTIDLPIKTVTRANAIMDTTSVFDSCLFKGGESFYDYEIVAKSNKVYGSYGTGNASIYYSPRAAYVRAKDNVVIRNLNFYGNILVRDVDSCVLKDLNVYGVTGSRNNVGGIQIQGILLDEIRVERCTVKNFAEGLRVYPVYQSDVNDMDSLIIDACYIDSCYRDDDNYDGIRVIGNMNANSIDYGYKAIIRNCEVKNWSEDAIDLAYASNVIVERNFLHDNKFPNNYDFESTGIKIGEQNASTSFKGSTGNIIRYNKIYNINRPTHLPTDIAKGINASRTNDALIHHNLVYNVAGVGFYQNGLNTVDVDPSYHIKFFNNTVSVDSNCFLTASGGSNVRSYVKNNIFITKGIQNTILALEDTRIGKNIFVKRGGVYEGNTPTRTSVAVWQKYGDIDSSSTSYYGIDSTALFPGAGDYEITTTSYTGEDLDLLYDIEGNAVDGTNPDCGAYEYDGSYLWLLFGLKRRKKHA